MVHVVVVGAGIIGATLADALARGGAAVTVLESAEPGSGTSGSSLAWLNANRKLPRHYHDLSARALAEWRELAAELGRPSWHVPTGSLTWAATDDEQRTLDERLARLRDWGYPAEEITARRVAELEPALRLPRGARPAFFPGEAFVHGDQAVRTVLARATAAGARLVVAEDDVTLDVGDAGVTAARLPDGTAIRADVYAVCAGRHTPRLLAPLGVPIPLADPDAPGSPAPCLVTRTSRGTPISRVINAPGLSLRPLARHGVQLESADVNDLVATGTAPAALARRAAELVSRAGRLLAGFDAGEARHRVCVRPLPADGHPIVGALPANVYVSVTHSGMTLGPLLARLAAREILTGEPAAELAPYRPDRFARSAFP